MTNKDKQLLLKDLCARLPYGVICHYNCVIPSGKRVIKKANARDVLKGIIPIPDGHIGFMVGIDKVDALEGDIKPYLRPMQSMTEEERNEYLSIKMQETERVALAEIYRPEAISEIKDWLDSHYFDYRGLIPMGLAIEAPESMYE